MLGIRNFQNKEKAMFITKGTKIQLVKPMGILTNVGEVFEVFDLKESGAILFKINGGFGYMSLDEFNRYFKIYEEEKKVETPKRKWSEWEYDWFYYFDLTGEQYIVPVKFRTNGKIVDLRTNWKTGTNEDGKEIVNIRARAFCIGDTFR
jgi:hypothetical protein